MRVGEAVPEINPPVFSFPASAVSEKEYRKSTLIIVAAIQKIVAVLKVTSNFGCVVTLTQQDDGMYHLNEFSGAPLFSGGFLDKTTTSVVLFSADLSEGKWHRITTTLSDTRSLIFKDHQFLQGFPQPNHVRNSIAYF
ncbi:unnamed protein product [Lactuca virosa]|uniref:rRNA N-glycosidase n=1 Tax=Lactuca virosa TaxID=75947 RepID=A0AAU9N7K3_9ASTR|nr:unnamed protein product [Lactuca virosa]